MLVMIIRTETENRNPREVKFNAYRTRTSGHSETHNATVREYADNTLQTSNLRTVHTHDHPGQCEQKQLRHQTKTIFGQLMNHSIETYEYASTQELSFFRAR